MAEEKKISPSQLFWFKIISISIPFIILIVIEVLLRVFDYGTNYDLFVEKPDEEGYLVMSPKISEKYFNRSADATIGFFETFKKDKENETFRIFVLGASTAVGFPYLHNGSFHRMLQWQLQRQYPEQKIEVINLSLTAINSYTLHEFAGQLINYQPDAVLIYAGHNEYYGALGVGATNAPRHWPWLVRLSLKLKKLRIIQLVFNTFNSDESSKADLKENLMKRMVKSAEIPYRSKAYLKGVSQFKSNLELIIKRLTDNQVPVIMGTLICNEKDQPPLISKISNPKDSITYQQALNDAKSLIANKKYDDAIQLLDSLLDIDTTVAATYYFLANAFFENEDFEKALTHFQQAKDYDVLRFRAPQEMNKVIISLAEKYNVAIADVEGLFRKQSHAGIIGEKLVLEHLHPNLYGYRLMADAYLEEILDSKLLPGNSQKAHKDWEEYPLTKVDTLYGWYNTLILKEGWPFYQEIKIDTTNRTLPEAIAGALVVKQISWEQAMEKLYQYYHQKDDYEKALRVTKAVLLEYPKKPEFYAKAGSLFLRLQDFSNGAAYFTEAYRLHQDSRYAYYAAICYSREKEWARAGDLLEMMLKNNPKDLKSASMLKTIRETALLADRALEQQNKQLLLQLARNYFLLGLKDDAREICQKILALHPKDDMAQQLLQKLNEKSQT